MNFLHFLFEPYSDRNDSSTPTTELSRLMNMRIHHLESVSCGREDLISSLHANSSCLMHAHNIELWGLKYWLMNSDVYPGRFAALDGNGSIYCEQDHMTSCNLPGAYSTAAPRRRNDSAACERNDNDDSWKRHFNDTKQVCEAVI